VKPEPDTNLDMFTVMETCRAMRYLRPDPIPETIVDRLIWAATRAPSPGNSQGWDFVIITDSHVRATIGTALSTAMAPRIEAMLASGTPMGDRGTLQGALHLARTIGDAPVIIVVCGQLTYPPQQPNESFIWSAIYPAAQNIILAARALGLGSVFTTYHQVIDNVLRDTLAIPEDVRIGALIPVGYPAKSFTPVARRPITDFVHRNRWQGNLRTSSTPERA
jgi:nitroreductase